MPHRADVIGEVVAASTTQFTAQCPRPLLHSPPAFGSFVRIVPASAGSSGESVRASDSGAPATPTRAPGADTNSPSANTGDAGAPAFSPLTATARSVPLSAAGGANVPASSPPIEDPFADPPPRPAVPALLPAAIPDDTLYAIVIAAGTASAEPGRRPAAYGLEEAELRRQQPQIFNLLATEFSAVHTGCARAGRFRPGIPALPARLHAQVTACLPDEVCAITESVELLRALVNVTAEAPADELIVACVRHAYECRGSDYPYLVRAGKQLAALLRDDPERLSALLDRLDPGE